MKILETTLILFGGLNENGYLSADLVIIELGNFYLTSVNSKIKIKMFKTSLNNQKSNKRSKINTYKSQIDNIYIK